MSTARPRWLPLAAYLAAALLALPAAHAGRSCDRQRLETNTLARGMALAERTHAALEAANASAGTHVVVLARAGQDLTRYGVRYSHLGFAYRTPQGPWRVVHKLNHCGTAEAALYRQGLGEFFLDDLWRHEAAWVVPTPAVQAALQRLLTDEAQVQALHHRPYSIVSYAWGQRYQQSNQWAIETLAAAMSSSARDRPAAQAWLRAQGYQPATLTVGPLTRLGGRMSAANVAFDDHPPAQRFADRIQTVTVDSVFAWLQAAGLGQAPVALRL